MPRFTIRVELHQATAKQYTDLYQQLAKVGIVDTIMDSKGVKYRLPPGEYNYEGSGTAQDISVKAQTCAGYVVSKYAVFVTESGGSGRSWNGLEVVN